MLNVVLNVLFVPGIVEQVIFLIDLNKVNLLTVPMNQIRLFIKVKRWLEHANQFLLWYGSVFHPTSFLRGPGRL